MAARGAIARIPVIHFLGIAPGRYKAVVPAYISGWDAKALGARVAFGTPEQDSLTPPEKPSERRYALRAVRHRLHQALLRKAVITAYHAKCALSGPPSPCCWMQRLRQPMVPNGIPLSKTHHAALEAYLTSIDPDYRLHVSELLLVHNDGAMLEALTRSNGGMILLPDRVRDRPDLDRLPQRFKQIRTAACVGVGKSIAKANTLPCNPRGTTAPSPPSRRRPGSK